MTPSLLREYLSYDSETGIFRWKKRPSNRVHVGDAAGGNSKGYKVIRILGVNYQAHRLAFCYVNNRWPKYRIDHINRMPSDNRIANLRECSQTQNAGNTGIWACNTSGVKGVSWDPRRKKWRARVGRSALSARFDTFDEAKRAREIAAAKYFGEFALEVLKEKSECSIHG